MPAPLNLSDLIDIVQLKNRGLPLDVAEAAVRRVFREIIKALADGRRVELRGFGVLELRDHEGGTRRNPKTGEAIEVPAKRAVHWKTGKGLAKAINEPAVEPQKDARPRG